MRAQISQPVMNTLLYDSSNPVNNSGDYPILNHNSTNSGSQIIEPEILIPVNEPIYTPPVDNTSNVEQVESGSTTSSSTTSGSTTSNTGTSTASSPNAVPSATTDSTKNYVNGGTTPDSNIVVKKPQPNYLIYGLIGVVGAYVIYKMFFNKKSE